MQGEEVVAEVEQNQGVVVGVARHHRAAELALLIRTPDSAVTRFAGPRTPVIPCSA